jgi:hypothetical protein
MNITTEQVVLCQGFVTTVLNHVLDTKLTQIEQNVNLETVKIYTTNE